MLAINHLSGFGGFSAYGPGSITAAALVWGSASTTSGPSHTSASFSGTEGRLLVVICAADNNGTNGASSFAGMTLATGGANQQTIFESVYDPGAAAAGAGLAVYTVDQTVTGSNTVTINFSPDTTSKALVVFEVWHTGGAPVSAVSSATAGATSAAPSVTLGSVLTDDYLIGLLSQETNAYGGDAIGWSRSVGGTDPRSMADTGAAATSITVNTYYRTASAAGSYTCEPILGASRDHLAAIVAIRTLP